MNNYTVVPIISSKCARFPRDYQLELYEIATKANTIVALPTGSGKTLISSLIMYHYLTHANHQDQIIVYLAPTGMLASQQSKALVEDTYELFEDSNVYVQLVIGEKSELISYNENNYEECFNFKLISTWKFLLNYIKKKNSNPIFKAKSTDCEEYDSSSSSSSFYSSSPLSMVVPKVFVFTPHIFLNYLCHGYFSMENIAVIIFDECHHVFGKSVYNEIMSIFYHQHYPNGGPKPLTRILGLTATPFNIVPYAKMNPNIISKSIHDDIHFLEAIYDSKVHFRLYRTLSVGDDCFYSDTLLHLKWKYTMDTLLWDPFNLVLTMNSAELNASLSFLTHENYNIFIQEVKQLRWCQPLSEMSENHSKCWSAKFFKRIKRNERLLSKLIELRMKWNTENSTIQKCIMGSWIKFRSECDILLKEHGLWGVIVFLDAIVKSYENKTDKRYSFSRHFLCNVSQLLSVLDFPDATSTANTGREWIKNYFGFEKKRIKFQRSLMDLFILLYKFFKGKTRIPDIVHILGEQTLIELYSTHLVSPKVIELEKVLRTLLDKFQPEKYKNDLNNYWKSERTSYPCDSNDDPEFHNFLSNTSESSYLQDYNSFDSKVQRTNKKTKIKACTKRECSSQLDFYLLKKERKVFAKSIDKGKNLSKSLLKKDSEQDNNSNNCCILTSYLKKTVKQVTYSKQLDSTDNQSSQDKLHKKFESHLSGNGSFFDFTSSDVENCQTTLENNNLTAGVTTAYHLSNLKCIVFTKTRVEAWLMHQYCQLRGISRTNYLISHSHNNLSHSHLIRHEFERSYSSITNRFSLPVSPSSPYLNILFSTNVLIEGFDVSCCNSVIALNPMRSVLDYIQCRGRIREKSNIKVCFKTICPDSITTSQFILMHRLYDIESLLLKAFDSHQHNDNKSLLSFKPLHTVVYQPTTKACISEASAAREVNETMLRYIRLANDEACHITLAILYDHMRNGKKKKFDNSMFLPFKKVFLEYTEETVANQQILNEIVECLEIYLKDHSSTTLLTFIKLLYQNNILNDHFFLHRDSRNFSSLCEKKQEKTFCRSSVNETIVWREPCALLCPDNFEVFVLMAKDPQAHINPYSFFQYIFQRISIGINSLSPIISLLKENQLCHSFCKHFINMLEDTTNAAWLLPPNHPNGVRLHVHRIFCCVESSDSVILSSGGLMGYWRPFYNEEATMQNDISVRTSYFKNFMETVLYKSSGTQTSSLKNNRNEAIIFNVHNPTVTELSGHSKRVLMPLALLLSFKLPKMVDVVGCYGQFRETIRIEIEPLDADGVHDREYHFSPMGMLALIRFSQSLLTTLAIKGCYPKIRDLREYEKILPDRPTTQIKHALYNSPFSLFAPLMSDGKTLDLNYIATYLKIIFLSFPSSKNVILSKKLINPTFYEYWLSSNHAFQVFLKSIPGVVTPFKNAQCGMAELLNQITAQATNLLLWKNLPKSNVSTDHKNNELDKKYLVDLDLHHNAALHEHVPDLAHLFTMRILEPPVIRLTHDKSCQHRFAELQGVILEYLPDTFYPENSHLSLTDTYKSEKFLTYDSNPRASEKIPILVGLRLQQGSYNILLDKKPASTRKNKLDNFYDSRFTSILPLTSPMFHQLTWMSCIMYKLDIWSKHYELTQKLESQMNVLCVTLETYLKLHLKKEIIFKPIILHERLVSLAMTAPSSRLLNQEADCKKPWSQSEILNSFLINETDIEEDTNAEYVAENDLIKYCHKDPHSQRIEFLGDSILKCITTIFFFFLGTSLDEGELTDKAHVLQSNKFLKHCSDNMTLHAYIVATVFMSKDSFFKGPPSITIMRRQVLSNKMQADAVEALIAAIYLSAIFVKKGTVHSPPFPCVSQSFYEQLEFNCLIAKSLGKFNEGLKASAIFLDILTLQEDISIIPFSFGALWYTISNFDLQRKVPFVQRHSKNRHSNILTKKPKNESFDFSQFTNEKLNIKILKKITQTYEFYMSYPKVIDASFIKEFTSNFPKHAKPFTNEQLINIWTQKNSKELLNEYSGVVTIARTHRSITSQTDLTHSYEQLEYLGDGVLSLLIADYLYKEFSLYDEGLLSQCKSLLQSNIFLAIRFLRKLVTYDEAGNTSILSASSILLCLLDDSFDIMENFISHLIIIPPQNDLMIAFYVQKYYASLGNPQLKNKSSHTINNYINIEFIPSPNQMKHIADIYESLLGATFLVNSCNIEGCWNCIQDDFQSVRKFLLSKEFHNMI